MMKFVVVTQVVRNMFPLGQLYAHPNGQCPSVPHIFWDTYVCPYGLTD